MGKFKGIIWNYYKNSDEKDNFLCVFCEKKFKKNATRQNEHLRLRCPLIPNDVKLMILNEASPGSTSSTCFAEDDCDDSSTMILNCTSDVISEKMNTSVMGRTAGLYGIHMKGTKFTNLLRFEY